jgi:dihydroxyacetone kinase
MNPERSLCSCHFSKRVERREVSLRHKGVPRPGRSNRDEGEEGMGEDGEESVKGMFQD